jgi:hypothetical protein
MANQVLSYFSIIWFICRNEHEYYLEQQAII